MQISAVVQRALWVICGAMLLSTAAMADQTLIAPSTEPGVVGRLNLGDNARGALLGSGDDEQVPFHTYVVEVPNGATRLVIKMRAKQDLDIALKYGSPIEAYNADDPDWDLVDQSSSGDALLMVDDPTAGKWYVDIMNALYESDAIEYTLSTSTRK